MSLVKPANIEFLIPHLKHQDIHLYEALLALKASTESITNIINNPASEKPTLPFFARAILPGVQTVANDILANRYHVKMPRDSAGVQLATKANLQRATITAKVLPVSAYTADMLVSNDRGLTFRSIFVPGGITLPGTDETIGIEAFQVPTLKEDDQIRVDILVADGTVAGVELLLAGYYS